VQDAVLRDVSHERRKQMCFLTRRLFWIRQVRMPSSMFLGAPASVWELKEADAHFHSLQGRALFGIHSESRSRFSPLSA